MQFARTVAVEFWATLLAMSPYLLFGFLAAGVLSVLISPQQVERHLGGRGIRPIFKAALFGVPLPLCSCGVIPVAASLRRHGSSKGATTAFLISTPQTGVDSILVTFSLLGPVFAIFRPLAALISGVLGGLAVEAAGNDRDASIAPPSCTDACCAPDARESKFGRMLRYGFLTLPKDIAKPLLLGLVVAGVIAGLVPDGFVPATLGTGFLAMLLMMAIGIPVYVCATASVPIAAAMLAKGVSPGAALVFLMTGPATNAATIATLWKMLGRRAAILYLLVVAVSALLSGLLLDRLFVIGGFDHRHASHFMLPTGLQIAAACVLLATLFAAWTGVFNRQPAPRVPAPPGENRTAFRVSGMTCSHCADTIRRTLAESAGVRTARVELQTSVAVIEGKAYNTVSIMSAVRELGYGIETTSNEEEKS